MCFVLSLVCLLCVVGVVSCIVCCCVVLLCCCVICVCVLFVFGACVVFVLVYRLLLLLLRFVWLGCACFVCCWCVLVCWFVLLGLMEVGCVVVLFVLVYIVMCCAVL